MKHRLLDSTEGRRLFVVVLEPDEEAVEVITSFAGRESLSGSTLTAIGGFSHSVLGYFDPDGSGFVRNEVDAQTEVLSMIGNLAVEDGEPKLHAHVVLGCRDATTRGGHLVAGWVRPTLEVIVEEAPEHLRRAVDERTGLILLQP